MGLADKSQQLHQSLLQSIRQILSNFQISLWTTIHSSDLYNLSCKKIPALQELPNHGFTRQIAGNVNDSCLDR